MTRPVEPNFGVAELLWRRIEKSDVDSKGALKGNRLRLQISVVRELYGNIKKVPQGKWNGAAETTAAAAAAVATGDVRVACVDDPNKDDEGHSLIVLIVEPGKSAPQHVVNAARALVALEFSVVVPPS